MAKKKNSLRFSITVVVIFAGGILAVKHFQINDFCVVNPHVLYTSGQPIGKDYTRLLYKYHIATIVNIRLPSEHRHNNWYPEEIDWVRSNGVRYVELPIEKSELVPDKETQNAFLATMADKDNLPVLLHAGRADGRVKMLAAVWLRRGCNYTVEQTLEALREITGESELTAQEEDFVKSLSHVD